MTTIEDTAIAAPPKKFIIEPRKAMMFITRKKITIPFLSAMTPLSETDGVLISLDASTIMIMPKIIMSTPATMTTAVMTLPAVAAPVPAFPNVPLNISAMVPLKTRNKNPPIVSKIPKMRLIIPTDFSNLTFFSFITKAP